MRKWPQWATKVARSWKLLSGAHICVNWEHVALPRLFFKHCILQEYSWVTLLWLFQVDSKGTQPYIHSPFSPRLPLHPACHVTLSRDPVLCIGHVKHCTSFVKLCSSLWFQAALIICFLKCSLNLNLSMSRKELLMFSSLLLTYRSHFSFELSISNGTVASFRDPGIKSWLCLCVSPSLYGADYLPGSLDLSHGDRTSGDN